MPCDRRTCPACARRRYHELKQTYEPLQEHLRAPRFVTVTLRRYPIGHPRDDVAALVERILDGFKKLRRRKLCRYVRGGFYAVEVKPPDPDRGLGWFVHIHALWDGPRIPQEALSAAWEEITGDSFRVDVRTCRKPESAVAYVLGYTTAGPKVAEDWAGVPEATRRAFEDAVEGRRLLQPFGHLLGKQAEDAPFRCPNCNARAWILLDLDPFLKAYVGVEGDWLAMTPQERLDAMYALTDRPPPSQEASEP